MRELISKFGVVSVDGNYMESAGLLFVDLIRSIAGQQLSVKAASTIRGRVEQLLGNEITPDKVLATTAEVFQGAGFSAPKTKYMKCTAETVQNRTLRLDKLKDLTDEKVITQLTAVKGIGRWTAEMFLIFALARPDVFSFEDGGLLSAIDKLYGEMPRTQQEEIVER